MSKSSEENIQNIVANKILTPCFTEDHIRDKNLRLQMKNSHRGSFGRKQAVAILVSDKQVEQIMNILTEEQLHDINKQLAQYDYCYETD